MKALIITSAAGQEDPGYVRDLLHPGDLLISADGGTKVALGLGLSPDLVVGDLDSLDEATRRKLGDLCPVRTFPVRKDKTDTHLAIEAALERDPEEVVVCGAFGDRLDHGLGLIALVAGLPPQPRIKLRSARQEAFFVRGGEAADIAGRAADVVSLIPFTPEVTGVSTEGLGYPLAGAVLRWGETLGVSNEMLGARAAVKVDGAGLLLVVHLQGAW